MQAEAKPEETNELNMILREQRQAGTLCKQVLLLLKTSVSTVRQYSLYNNEEFIKQDLGRKETS